MFRGKQMKNKKVTQKNEKNDIQKIKSRQIRLVIIAVAVLAIFALLLYLALSFVGALGEKDKKPTSKKYSSDQLEAYLQENWSEFTFVSFDPDSGKILLRGETDYTYEQAEKYGEAVFDEDYLSSYVNLVQQIAISVSVDCDIDHCKVCLDQYSTDGKVIYSVESGGQITACWQE